MIRTELGHFWITFDNGYTISVFNGYGSYTENHTNIKHWQEISKIGDIYSNWTSDTCEISVLDKNGIGFKTKEILNHHEDVIGHVSVSELIEYINIVKNYKDSDIK